MSVPTPNMYPSPNISTTQLKLEAKPARKALGIVLGSVWLTAIIGMFLPFVPDEMGSNFNFHQTNDVIIFAVMFGSFLMCAGFSFAAAFKISKGLRITAGTLSIVVGVIGLILLGLITLAVAVFTTVGFGLLIILFCCLLGLILGIIFLVVGKEHVVPVNPHIYAH